MRRAGRIIILVPIDAPQYNSINFLHVFFIIFRLISSNYFFGTVRLYECVCIMYQQITMYTVFIPSAGRI